MNKRIPIWMDVDTGVDDAIAILCAFKQDELEVVGLSAVAGNQTLDHTFANTRNVVYMAGHPEVKVYKGAEKPLKKKLHTAPMCHGENGLGDAKIEESNAEVQQEKAWDALYAKAKELNGELTIVAVGPLTNIATLLTKYPDVKNYIKQIAIMGGSATRGNRTIHAEFNSFADPHAGKIVYDSGIPIVMCGLDVTEKAYLSLPECDEIRGLKNKQAKLFKESINLALALYERANGLSGLCVHDACPLFYLIHPEWFEVKDAFVYVIEDGEKEGKTVTDIFEDKKQKPNTKVVMNVNREIFAKEIIETYKSY